MKQVVKAIWREILAVQCNKGRYIPSSYFEMLRSKLIFLNRVINQAFTPLLFAILPKVRIFAMRFS